MRAPRPRQRFPGGGKDLWELLRMDLEPVGILIFPVNEISKERARLANTLTYEPEFDPMLYFWPVENQWAVVQMKSPPHEDSLKRLVKALERDGAGAISVMWLRARTLEEREELDRNWLMTTEVRNFGNLEEYFRGAPHASPVAASA